MPEHPLTSFVESLHRPARPAADLGYRMPGEWEAIEAVWLTYPHNRETWPGCFERACEQYDYFMSQVARFANVQMTGRRHGIETDDSWVRDYGPLFVIDADGKLACHDFVFDGWGGKYGAAYGRDDVVPQHVARLLDVPIWIRDLVLEGGSIDVNGRGSVLTTEQCLLHENRNPHLDRGQLEGVLADAFGATNVIWLPGGIEGDDTDGHVDDVARFIGPDAVIAARATDADHPDHAALERNFEALRQARDETGASLELFELPAPQPLYYDYRPDCFGPGGRQMCPASYANFLLVNEAVLVPTFEQHGDAAAIGAIERALPDRTVIAIPSQWLVVGLGAVHCLSQHQPRVTPAV